MPRHARPVPPVCQLEVAAEAVVWAAAHRRREVVVGGSTFVVITRAALLALAISRRG